WPMHSRAVAPRGSAAPDQPRVAPRRRALRRHLGLPRRAGPRRPGGAAARPWFLAVRLRVAARSPVWLPPAHGELPRYEPLSLRASRLDGTERPAGGPTLRGGSRGLDAPVD